MGEAKKWKITAKSRESISEEISLAKTFGGDEEQRTKVGIISIRHTGDVTIVPSGLLCGGPAQSLPLRNFATL